MELTKSRSGRSFQEVLSSDGEEQVALRSGLRFGLRLARVTGQRSGRHGGPRSGERSRTDQGAFGNLALKTFETPRAEARRGRGCSASCGN